MGVAEDLDRFGSPMLAFHRYEPRALPILPDFENEDVRIRVDRQTRTCEALARLPRTTALRANLTDEDRISLQMTAEFGDRVDTVDMPCMRTLRVRPGLERTQTIQFDVCRPVWELKAEMRWTGAALIADTVLDDRTPLLAYHPDGQTHHIHLALDTTPAQLLPVRPHVIDRCFGPTGIRDYLREKISVLCSNGDAAGPKETKVSRGDLLMKTGQELFTALAFKGVFPPLHRRTA